MIYQRDRNLLVHHGGVYTSGYILQSFGKFSTEGAKPYFDSRTITKKYVLELLDFLQGIAAKTVKTSHGALGRSVSKGTVKMRGEYLKAISYFGWWGIPDEPRS